MGETHLNFSLQSSFGQRSSLVIIALLLFASFLLWPQIDNVIYLSIKVLITLSLMLFFIWQGWQLRSWQYQFSLMSSGAGHFSDGRRFTLVRRAFISPFAVIFYYQYLDGKQYSMMIVWADMLTDINYRHLCRLLIQK
ncbi:protein YgfX [Shewanella surugensis]|uniref:Uncharacterized protein n=1 Tax=Shewanella surugensis TaxID=212020 RepID=A0ABT0L619_9GAMM|nr:protein YgfX [Shewanella surugensis]MCL1123110.1 hypothetical protein [Shewanella surugensis]